MVIGIENLHSVAVHIIIHHLVCCSKKCIQQRRIITIHNHIGFIKVIRHLVFAEIRKDIRINLVIHSAVTVAEHFVELVHIVVFALTAIFVQFYQFYCRCVFRTDFHQSFHKRCICLLHIDRYKKAACNRQQNNKTQCGNTAALFIFCKYIFKSLCKGFLVIAEGCGIEQFLFFLCCKFKYAFSIESLALFVH